MAVELLAPVPLESGLSSPVINNSFAAASVSVSDRKLIDFGAAARFD